MLLNNRSYQFYSFLCFFLIILLSEINGSARLIQTTNVTATIEFQLKKGKQTNSFALTTSPNLDTKSSVYIRNNNNGKISQLRELSAGWMGNKYLQWYSFSSELISSDTAKIKITFDSPSLLSNSNLSITGPIIDLPLLNPPRSKIKRMSLPTNNVSYGLRIEISEDGMYKISGDDLKNIGIPIDNINAKFFKLYCKNIEIPIFISGSEDGKIDNQDNIFFYGYFLRGENSYYTSYTYDNVYWLTWDNLRPGIRYTEVSGGSEKDPNDYLNITINKALPFLDTIHIEKDNDIRWLGDLFEVSETGASPSEDDTIDNWYWGFAGDKELTHFTFNLPSPDININNYVKLKIAMGGLSNLNDLDPDHNFSIHLNDDPTRIEAIWDGQNEIIVESNIIPSSRIKNGENKITLIKNLPDSIPDRVAVNWFEFTYKRDFTSQDNSHIFKTTKNAENRLTSYTIKRFTSKEIDLWDIHNFRKFRNINITSDDRFFSATFLDSLSSKGVFNALAKSKYQSPAKMKLDTITNSLFSVSPDYIIISTDTLLNTLDPLIALHKENGLNVSSFDIQDIYNTFSYGIHNPESIRDAIKYIYSRNSSNPPQYLLLGGDASHDMDKQKRYLNVIPTHLSRTPNWGPSADDGYFTKVNGEDNFMDLKVGRLPASTPEDMKIMVDKTVNYLNNPEQGLWRDNIVLAGGFENNFTKFNNEAVNSLVENKMNIYRMDADPTSDFYIGGSSASDKLAGYINTGVYFINFLGHGGGNVWSDSKFFSYSDLEKLHNSKWSKGGRLPIIFSFTCLTGFFESVFYKSLGEEFLRNSQDGAISFYGAAGYTRRNIDISMSRTLLDNGLNSDIKTLGDLTHITEIMMLAQNESEALPLINQYNLLGDPLIPWTPTKQKTTLTLNKKQFYGLDTLTVTGTTQLIESGKASIKIKSGNSLWEDKIVDINNGIFSSVIPLKEKSNTTEGIVRTFVWNDSITELGLEYFSKDAFSLYDIVTTPAIPIAGDTLNIKCRIDLPDSTEQPIVQCLYTIGDPAEESYNFSDSTYTFMTKDSLTNIWSTNTAIKIPEDDIASFLSPHLILQFKSTGSLGISPYYTFKIRGIADLTFLNENCKIKYFNDSLRLTYSILNSGTEKAFLPEVLFYTDANDTLFYKQIIDTINAGETFICTTAIHDLNGNYVITGVIDSNNKIDEKDKTNNTVNFNIKVSSNNLLVPTDTLKSFGSSIFINPTSNLSSQRKIFLFYDTLNNESPLLSSSQFISSLGDGNTSVQLFSRPDLSPTDSLNVAIHTVPNRDDSISKSSIFSYNDEIQQWRLEGLDIDSSKDIIKIVTQSSNKLAPVIFSDNTGPQIRAYVNGKEVIYVDYVAKGMPFNILIIDSSGIDPSSITLSVNNTELSNDAISDISNNNDASSVTLTVYPPEIHAVDTLTVQVSDLAGNKSIRDFIYRPGKTLDIKFFSCHPNPFAARKGDKIRFAYLLTDVATNIEMTIYTISGRKVWKWKNSRQLTGYQEIVWDGTTMNNRINGKGYRLANGTYYAKLVAKNSKRKVKKIIRIAKLEGY